MFGRTLIISGGVVEMDFAQQYLENQRFDTVVCADSGLDSAWKLGLPVHYAMGDFDSVSKKALEEYQGKEENQVQGQSQHKMVTKFVEYPPEKDATDTQLVLEWAVEQGAREIVILGATGKRLDHFLANVNILMKPLLCGIPAYIVDACNRLYLVNHSITLQRKEQFGKYLSLLPFTEKVTGVTLRGLKYGLEDRTLTIGDSIGVSNELAVGEDAARIELREGILIVVESRD